MYEIRQYQNEYVIGRVNCYTNLFTCYDCFGTLKDAIKAIKRYSKRYELVIN